MCFKSFSRLVVVALLIGANQGQLANEADVIVTPEAETIVIETTLIETPVTPFECEGQEKPLEDSPCGGCSCFNNEWMCQMASCLRAPCVDAVTKPDQCCEECPNGPNCYIDGVLVPMDQDYVRPDGSVCFCQYNSGETEVLCIPPFITPPGCEGLQKPVDDGPCSYCSCESDWLGQAAWSCIVADCMEPNCVDAVREPGQCCAVCPNGPNCYIDGVLVPMNQDYVRPDGSVCFCEEGSPWEQANVICTPPTDTTTPAGCENQPKPVDGSCAVCSCENWSGKYEWICYSPMCLMPQCVDPVTQPGQCCPECPNGPNCYLEDQIVPLEKEVVMSDGSICFCQSSGNYWSDPVVICMPPTPPPTTTPAGCEGLERPFEDGPCGGCICDNWDGEYNWYCYMAGCIMPNCVDPVKKPDQCCQECPNGPNCYIDGVIVPMGQEYVRSDGSVCFCQQNDPWQQPDVICMPPFTSPAGCQSQEKPWDSPCANCDCVDWSGVGNAEWVCWITDCFPAPCVDKISVPNECCETCPNGPNCESFGEIIPLGVNKTINGLECHCEYTFILEAPIAVCNPILTTTLETITPSPVSSTTQERTTLRQILTTTSETITPSPISSTTQERSTLRLVSTTTSETITPSPISSTTQGKTTLRQILTTTSEKTTPNKNRKRISTNADES